MNSRLPSSRSGMPSSKPGGKPARSESPPWVALGVKIATWTGIISLIVGGGSGIALLVLILVKREGIAEVSSLTTLIGCFEFFFVTGFLALTAAKYTSRTPAWLFGVIGAALASNEVWMVMLANSMQIEATKLLDNGAAKSLHGIGVFLVIFCILYLIAHYIVGFAVTSKRQRSKKLKYIDDSKDDARRRSLIPKCWEMSRCRPNVRMTCPNYIDRFTCWKRRSGCFCDTDLANYLVSMSGKGEAQEAMDLQRMAGKMSQRAGFKRKDGNAKRPWTEQRKLCHECPLYLEHQEYKYKNLGWVSFPVTGLAVVAAYPIFDPAYQYGIGVVQGWLEKTNMGNFTPDISGLGGEFEYLLLFVLGLLLLGYVISLVETFFLRWKW